MARGHKSKASETPVAAPVAAPEPEMVVEDATTPEPIDFAKVKSNNSRNPQTHVVDTSRPHIKLLIKRLASVDLQDVLSAACNYDPLAGFNKSLLHSYYEVDIKPFLNRVELQRFVSRLRVFVGRSNEPKADQQNQMYYTLYLAFALPAPTGPRDTALPPLSEADLRYVCDQQMLVNIEDDVLFFCRSNA